MAELIICDGCYDIRGPKASEHKCHGIHAQVAGEPVGRPCECPFCNSRVLLTD